MTGKRVRMAGLAAALAATTAISGATIASGDGGAKTEIKVQTLTASKMAGTITSSKASCLKNRHVQIFRLDGYVSVKVDRDNAQSDGDWKFTRSFEPGRYFAKVDSKPGCRYDVSKNETLK